MQQRLAEARTRDDVDEFYRSRDMLGPRGVGSSIDGGKRMELNFREVVKAMSPNIPNIKLEDLPSPFFRGAITEKGMLQESRTFFHGMSSEEADAWGRRGMDAALSIMSDFYNESKSSIDAHEAIQLNLYDKSNHSWSFLRFNPFKWGVVSLIRLGIFIMCLSVVGCASKREVTSDRFKGVSETVSLMLEEERVFNASHSLEGMAASDAAKSLEGEGFFCQIEYARVPISLIPLAMVDVPNFYCRKSEPKLKDYCPNKMVIVKVEWRDPKVPMDKLYRDAQLSPVKEVRFHCHLK